MTATIYGVALNDAAQRDALSAAFLDAPYKAPPEAPVLYIKPATCITHNGGSVSVPAGWTGIEAAATIAIAFSGRPNVPTAAALAIDLCEPHASYFRPAIRQRCRDGFLPLGSFDGDCRALSSTEITLSVDGRQAHVWRLDRLVRDLPALIGAITAFMTLSDNDILLVGVPGDAPRVGPNSALVASAAGFTPLSVRLVQEIAS